MEQFPQPVSGTTQSNWSRPDGTQTSGRNCPSAVARERDLPAPRSDSILPACYAIGAPRLARSSPRADRMLPGGRILPVRSGTLSADAAGRVGFLLRRIARNGGSYEIE